MFQRVLGLLETGTGRPNATGRAAYGTVGLRACVVGPAVGEPVPLPVVGAPEGYCDRCDSSDTAMWIAKSNTRSGVALNRWPSAAFNWEITQSYFTCPAPAPYCVSACETSPRTVW